MAKGDSMAQKVSDPFDEAMKKQERIVDKVKGQDDSLLKLRELFNILGLDIEFDHQEKRATLKQKGINILMRYNGDHGYFLKDGKKLIAFELREYPLFCHYGAKMEVVIVDEDNHFQVATFTQGETLGGNEEPRFTISDYQNSSLNRIYTDGHFIELTHGNVLDLGSAEILSSWGVELPHKYKLGSIYTTLGFGAHMSYKDINSKNERNYDYIPTVTIDTIKKGIGTTKRTLIFGDTAGYQELKYTVIPAKLSKSSILPYSKYIGMQTIVDPADRQFFWDDLAYQQAVLELLQSEEGLDTYSRVYNFFNKQPLSWFLEIYYGHLFRGIKFYQKGPEKNLENSPLLEKK